MTRWGNPLLVALLAVMLFDGSGWDMPMAQWFGSSAGFALRDHPVYDVLLYGQAKQTAVFLLVVLAINIAWPQGVFQKLPRRHRALMFINIVMVAIIVPAFKAISESACPWDLIEFGSDMPYISHWDFTDSRYSSIGGCFPGGHAVTGFCFFSVAFWLQAHDQSAARNAFALTLFVGIALGIAQQIRGAHFMSHTLWSAWLCCAGAWALHAICMGIESTWRTRRSSRQKQ